MAAFSPVKGGTVTLAATTASGSVALTKLGHSQYEVYNDGPNTAFVYLSIAGETISGTTEYPVPAYQSRLISVDPKATTAYGICATGTAALYFAPGVGD